MPQIFFSIGTNLGDREENIRRALILLNDLLPINALSTIYETEPWGPIQDQPSFLNLCAVGRSDKSPLDILMACKEIEEAIGRIKGERWGPRLIDIDLLFYDQLIRQEGRLTLPHAQIEKRAFVLVPLADIAPDFVHPVEQKSIKDLLSNIESTDVTPYTTNKPVYLAGNSPVIWGQKTLVMGILNATPDSFSGDGLLSDPNWRNRAVKQAVEFVEAGADILDVGGASTRPGATPVLPEEELRRVVPLIDALRTVLPDTIISIDTFRSNVARAALDAGANWINDVTGLQNDPKMIEVIQSCKAPTILMHNGRGRARIQTDDGYGNTVPAYHYNDLIHDVLSETRQLRDQVTPFHISPQSLVLDPGIGFGKAGAQNIKLISQLGRFKSLGMPLLLGSSRKSFIGHYTGISEPEKRFEGTAVTNVIGILQGANIIRVHDVEGMVRVTKMTDAFLKFFE